MTTLRSKIKTGIILYETIVAAVVITVCIAVTLRAFTASLKAARVTEYYLQANSLMKEKCAEYALIPHVEPGEYEGSFDNHYSSFTWHTTIEEILTDEEIEEIAENEAIDVVEETSYLFKIEIRISWEIYGNNYSSTIVSFYKKDPIEKTENISEAPDDITSLSEGR